MCDHQGPRRHTGDEKECRRPRPHAQRHQQDEKDSSTTRRARSAEEEDDAALTQRRRAVGEEGLGERGKSIAAPRPVRSLLSSASGADDGRVSCRTCSLRKQVGSGRSAEALLAAPTSVCAHPCALSLLFLLLLVCAADPTVNRKVRGGRIGQKILCLGLFVFPNFPSAPPHLAKLADGTNPRPYVTPRA